MKVRRVDFSPDEWIAGTVDLSLAERGMYITACSLIYSRGGEIATGILRSFCHEDLRTYNRCLQKLLDLGKLEIKDGHLSNKRCLSELQLAANRSATAAENVAKRWSKSKENNEITDTAVLPPSNANHQPSTINHQTEEKGSLSGAKKETRASRLPGEFRVPTEWISAGADARVNATLPPADLATEAIKFVNHFTSSNKTNALKKDWQKTWINWCLNARGQANAKQGSIDSLIEGFGRAAGLGGRPPDREPDRSAVGPLLDGEYVRLDA
jgi:uncharacterized protein YdaU (DUF1376 family)